MQHFIPLLVLSAFFSFANATDADADLDFVENCVSIARIDHTKIIDDQTIVFYMRGDDIYVNNLPKRCPGLKRADSYSYRTSISQLCNVDLIRVLDSFAGDLPRPGVACGLGKFTLSSPEAVELLLAEPDVEPDPEAIAAPDVE